MTKRLTQLIDALAVLIPFRETAFSFVERAQINTTIIDFYGSPLTMWANIIRYAESNKQVNDLVKVILEKFPKNPHLLSFMEAIEQDYSLGPDIRNIRWQERLDEQDFEKITGEKSTLLPIRFLEIGMQKARSVARVLIPRAGRNELGSGFLTPENIFITNNHVIGDKETARIALIQFNYEESVNKLPVEKTDFRLDPDSFFETSAADDWTAVRIKGDANENFAFLELKTATVGKGDFVNIVQHPGGRYKELGLYHNLVTHSDDRVVQYLTDTEPGSSGSPVFNSEWQLVALHHSGGMFKDPDVPAHQSLRNEGINIERVIAGLKK